MVKKMAMLVTLLGLMLCIVPVNAVAVEPTITFDTIQPSGLVDKADLSAFTVSVEGDITVSSVTLRIDGRVVDTDTTAPYTFDVSLAEMGSHKAEAVVLDSNELYYRKTAWFNLVTYTDATPIGTDFEGFSEHPTNGVYGSVEATIVTNVTISPVDRDEEDPTAGTCLLVDTAEGAAAEHYLQKTLSGNSLDKLFYSTADFKFTNVADTTTYISLFDRSGNNNQFYLIYASGAVYVNGTQVATIDNPQDTWHTVSVLVNQKLGVEDLWIDGELIARGARPYDNGGIATTSAGLMRLRYRPRGGSDVLFDNFYTHTVTESVYATGEAATHGQKSFSFTPSRALADNITTANFSLESELGAAEIDSVTLGENKLVTVTTKEELEPANMYTLKIKSGTPLGDTTTVSVNTRYVFNTTARETDWVTGDFCPITEGYIFSGTVANATGGTLRAVCAAFDSTGAFINCKIVPVAADGTFSVRESGGHNMQIKGFVVDENWNPISDKFYSITLE